MAILCCRKKLLASFVSRSEGAVGVLPDEVSGVDLVAIFGSSANVPIDKRAWLPGSRKIVTHFDHAVLRAKGFKEMRTHAVLHTRSVPRRIWSMNLKSSNNCLQRALQIEYEFKSIWTHS